MNAEAAEAYIRQQLDQMLIARSAQAEKRQPAKCGRPRIHPVPVPQPPRIVLAPTVERLRYKQNRVLLAVAAAHRITPEDIIGKSRVKKIVAARQQCCWLLRMKTGMSFPQIGFFLGYDDHSTAMHGVKKFQAEIDQHTNIMNLVERILDGEEKAIQP